MVKFIANNAENLTISYTFFESNQDYHSWFFDKKDINFWYKFFLVNKLVWQLLELILVFCNKFFDIQEL